MHQAPDHPGAQAYGIDVRTVQADLSEPKAIDAIVEATSDIEVGLLVANAAVEQFGAFGHPDRDPRERIITIAYYSLISAERLTIKADSDAQDARLYSMNNLPELATDHPKILGRAYERVKEKVHEPVIALQLVPAEFTLTDRSGMNYPVLIGRAFLANRIIVNSEATFATTRSCQIAKQGQ